MNSKVQRKFHKKIALALSLCMTLIWALLGTGASLAWFRDTSPEIINIFHFADFELEVSYRLPNGTYEKIDDQTKIFDEEVLYEAGYVQVVYLKIENKGDCAFDFNIAVNVTDYTVATNIFGQSFNLQDYLKFGFVTDKQEDKLESKVASRTQAVEIAEMKLNNYATDEAELEAGETIYMALIVRMPEEIGNEANYRGEVVPKVELGIIVKAEQQVKE